MKTKNDLRLKFKFDTGLNASSSEQAQRVEAFEVVDFTDLDCSISDLGDLLIDLPPAEEIDEEIISKLITLVNRVESDVEAVKKHHEDVNFDIELDSIKYIGWLEDQLLEMLNPLRGCY